MNDADRIVRVQLRLALSCLVLALLGGACSVLHYLEPVSRALNALGLPMQRVRPVHTAFVTFWIYGAAIAAVYAWLGREPGGLRRGDVVRFRIHTVLWTTSGVGIFVCSLLGIGSGREYLEFPPIFAVPLLVGWLCFSWSFWSRAFRGFWGRPVHVWMWTVGTCLFTYEFVEAQAWLLPEVGANPLRDLQVQWKSCGALVGSFNFMVYGTIAWLRERLGASPAAGHSRWTFALFGVGCLNSFTNYVHHVYHVPMDVAPKWIAFVVSMAEALILWRVLLDVIADLRAAAPAHPALPYLVWTRRWNAANLALAIAMSVPAWNSLIHGTHVVPAHAMGAEIGVDSMALFAAVTWLLAERRPAAAPALAMPQRLLLLNVVTAGLVGWLVAIGVANGWTRYHGETPPGWVSAGTAVFPVLGTTFALVLAAMLQRWFRVLAAAGGAA